MHNNTPIFFKVTYGDVTYGDVTYGDIRIIDRVQA